MIVGTPIDADDKLIIPISKTSLGFGVGVADNKGTNERTKQKMFEIIKKERKPMHK